MLELGEWIFNLRSRLECIGGYGPLISTALFPRFLV